MYVRIRSQIRPRFLDPGESAALTLAEQLQADELLIDDLLLNADLSYEMGDIEEAAKSFEAAFASGGLTDDLRCNSLLWLAECQHELGQADSARRNAGRVKQSPSAFEKDKECAD